MVPPLQQINYVQFPQAIEGYNFKKFVGQTATFSYWIKAGKTGTMCVNFKNSASDRSYIAETVINSANTWEKKSITLDFDYSGGTWNYTNGIGLYANFILVAGSDWYGTANTWQSSNLFATVNQTNFADNTDATSNVWITGVQLELGSTATDFEFLDQAIQLNQCQRYYIKTGKVSGVLIADVYNTAGTNHNQSYQFPVSMRVAPTLTKVGTWIILNLNAQPTIGNAYVDGFVMTGITTSLGRSFWFCGSANEYITADAEL